MGQKPFDDFTGRKLKLIVQKDWTELSISLVA